MSKAAEELTQGEGEPQVEITLDEGTGIPGTEEGEGTKRAKGRARTQAETTPTGFEVGQADGTYTKAQVDEMLAKVRKEEKDKLYPQIDGMKGELSTLTKEREERVKAEEDARKEAEKVEAKRLKDEMDLRTRLETSEQEWGKKLEDVTAELERRDAIIAKEREWQVLLGYITQRRQEEERELRILPELADLVGLNASTEEEVEQTIAGLRARSEAIMSNVAAATQQQRQQMRGTSVTAPPMEPTENSPVQMRFTTEQIDAMSPAEFAKYREPLLKSTSPSRRNGG